MTDSSDMQLDRDDFCGVGRLFPLPNSVLFPHVVQPLRIFEPRYCAMMRDALAGDKLLAMAVLSPGWEADYDGRPPIATNVCLGRIMSHNEQDDGQFTLLLVGLWRARVVRELPPDRPFRSADLELLSDVYPAEGASSRPALRKELLDAFRQFIPEIPEALEPFEKLLHSQIPLGMLTDVVGYTLPLDTPGKLQLLGELNVDIRARFLLEQLANFASGNDGDHKFPPDFSRN